MDFGAYVTAAFFDRSGAGFALGDGSVRWESGETVQAHDGAVLSATVHPSGQGVLTGGDDGRLVWSRRSGAEEIASIPGRWIDTVAAAPASGLIAFGAGRELHVRDAADPKFSRTFAHERSVADVAFDAKGRRIAVATYGRAALWYARIADQKPVFLKWAGSHVGVGFSPDGRFLFSAMQENALHGWRLSDAKDMRMGGYPAKPRSLAFLGKGALMATAGSHGAVVWPLAGPNGPMGKEAAEVGYDESALVTRVAGAPDKTLLAAGLDDGRVWLSETRATGIVPVKAEKGPPITALAMSAKGDRVAWGDEEGGAGAASVELS
ncbi:MAG TPA: WD40 repeat domain-containing protein [Caulobacteraceae bacterium]|jgi:WD40 repeat protein